MFAGYTGFVQADAKSVFDVLFRVIEDRARSLEEQAPKRSAPCVEVACWSHARTKFWEAAVATQDVVARESLARIMCMFHLDAMWKSRLPDVRKDLRDRYLRPLRSVEGIKRWTVDFVGPHGSSRRQLLAVRQRARWREAERCGTLLDERDRGIAATTRTIAGDDRGDRELGERAGPGRIDQRCLIDRALHRLDRDSPVELGERVRDLL